ncbi:MAG: hypothetical protein ABIP46_10675 [Polaromonas sp.]
MTTPDSAGLSPTPDIDLDPANDNGSRQHVAVPYYSSEDIHQLLALLELPADGSPSGEELQQARDAAFSHVIALVRKGLIELDFQPFEHGTVDIPGIDHPHYMQALLYWSALLDCTPTQLVDAYARLGSMASAESVFGLLKSIRKEELLAATSVQPTQRPRSMQTTQPAFANTTAQVLK